MSDLYVVKVQSRDSTSGAVRLKVTELDGADGLPESRAFFLKALHESSDVSPFPPASPYYRAPSDPIAEAIDYDQSCDLDFLYENAGRFVTGVRRDESSLTEPGAGEGPSEEVGYIVDEWGESVEFLVEVSEPRWTAHLTAGKEWGTASYF